MSDCLSETSKVSVQICCAWNAMYLGRWFGGKPVLVEHVHLDFIFNFQSCRVCGFEFVQDPHGGEHKKWPVQGYSHAGISRMGLAGS